MVPLPTVVTLDSLSISVVCPVPWDAMRGDNRARFCDKCSQHVYDVSELTGAEALRLVTDAPACLQLYRRQDGRVMTADCIGRRERVWRRLHRHSPWAAAAFALVFFAGCGPGTVSMGKPSTVGRPSHLPPPDDAVQSVLGGAAAQAAKGHGTTRDR